MNLGVGGWFKAPDRQEGIVRIEQPPRWAGGCLGLARYAPAASGIGGGKIATVDQPQAAGKVDQAKAEERQAFSRDGRLFLSRYAQYRMVHEHGLGRQGTITGPLRMDIAPGSSVAIQATGDPTNPNDRLASTFYGTVLRISHALSAESGEAFTSLHLSHIRTAEQNLSPGHALRAHPLYQDTYLGAPLYDDMIAASDGN